jgi:hypothetical protein
MDRIYVMGKKRKLTGIKGIEGISRFGISDLGFQNPSLSLKPFIFGNPQSAIANPKLSHLHPVWNFPLK